MEHNNSLENTENVVEDVEVETLRSAPSPPPSKDTSVDLVEKDNGDSSEEESTSNTEKSENVAVDKHEEVHTEDGEAEIVDEPANTSNIEYDESITNSIIEITKSQIIDSEMNEESDKNCHKQAEFIMSTNNEMIDSTYEKNSTDGQESTEEKKSEINSENLNKSFCEDKPDEIAELKESMITSLDIQNNIQTLEENIKDELSSISKQADEIEEAVNKTETDNKISAVLTESCVDLGADETELNNKASIQSIEESIQDAAHNNSMEIIDRKQCENANKQEDEVNQDDEDFEKVEVENAAASLEKQKRKLEDEEYEKPLGGDSLLKKTTQYGEEMFGRDYRPSSGQMCTISYEACIKDSDTVVEKNEQLSFILGDGDVVSALDLVISLMSKNEKCDMITEARHAYGTQGKKPDIPANATLNYKIHLIDFKDVTELCLMEPIERLSMSEAKKLRGNFHFNRQDFHLSAASYKKGLKYFDLENLKGEEEDDDVKKFAELKKALLMNLALSFFKQSEYKKALNSLNDVLGIEPSHMKALYIRGKVLMHLGETQEAIQSLSKAHELANDNVEVKNELTKAQAKHKLQYEKEKKMYKKMMQSPSEEKKIDVKAKAKSDSSFIAYAAAGLIMGGAAIGMAMLAKSKNLL